MMQLDHLVISTERLDDGVAFVEDLFGVTMAPGGRHDVMGTHNRLLSLGPDLYLEVIAVDPDAPAPARPRWYDLDRFDGPPRLTQWVVRCADLERALETAPQGTGLPMDVRRGDLTWRMAVPADGVLPLDGRAPALICWGDTAHPAARLPDAGCRLTTLAIHHPDAARLTECYGEVPGVTLHTGTPVMKATFETPNGPVFLTDATPPAAGSDAPGNTTPPR